jgi:hypothetical protein
VSIDSLQSNPWANPWAASTASQSAGSTPGSTAPTGSFLEIDQVQATFSTAAANGPGQNAAGMSAAVASPANPLQNLASDIQAMLIQAQNAAAQSGANGGTKAAATPAQSVATDLQTILGDIQAAIAPNTQTANTNPTAPNGETGHHRHHHQHGGDANGASNVAAASSGSGTSTAGSQLASDQAVSSIFATDIAQAIQAYGGSSTSATTPALMV